MSLVISVTKTEAAKAFNRSDYIARLCEAVIEREDTVIYIPLSGNMVDVLKFFIQNDITYELKMSPDSGLKNISGKMPSID
jgi:hypothetical protein